MGRYIFVEVALLGSNEADDYTKGDNWNDLLKEVVTFDSVEEFWGVYVSYTSILRDGCRNC